MKNPTIFLKTTKIFLINVLTPTERIQTQNFALHCSLKWKRKILIVSYTPQLSSTLSALENFHWSISCLRKSCVHIVCVDLKLNYKALKVWANISLKSKKSIFVRLPIFRNLPKFRHPIRWMLKRFIDFVVAFTLLLSLSPIFLLMTIVIFLIDPGPIFSRYWYVGERGKLFQVFKFKISAKRIEYRNVFRSDFQKQIKYKFDDYNLSWLASLIFYYRLDSLPMLFNVLLGEMSIVGPAPVSLYFATQMTPDVLSSLRALPGVISINSVYMTKKNMVSAIENPTIVYLENWSLLLDLKIMYRSFKKYFGF